PTASPACSRPSGRRSGPDVRVLLATRSADKAREIRHILDSVPGLTLLTLLDLGLGPDPAEESLETFETFQENATAKARHFARLASLPVLADASGLLFDAIAGAPGARTTRFSRPPSVSIPAL